MLRKLLPKHRLTLLRTLFPEVVAYCHKLEQGSARQTSMIRRMIVLSGKCETKKETFYDRFLVEIRPRALKKAAIVDFDLPERELAAYLWNTRKKDEKCNGAADIVPDKYCESGYLKSRLTESDIIFLSLHIHDFTPAELNTIYNYGNHKTVTVRLSRMRTKLGMTNGKTSKNQQLGSASGSDESVCAPEAVYAEQSHM